MTIGGTRGDGRGASTGGGSWAAEWTQTGHVGLFFFQAEDGIRDIGVTGVQTCALPISQISMLGGAHRRTRHLNGETVLVRPPLEYWPDQSHDALVAGIQDPWVGRGKSR